MMDKQAFRLLIAFLIILTISVVVVTSVSAQNIPAPGDVRNDGRPLTVGMVFQADSPSVVTGLHFYRAWTGPVTGQLWSQKGELLATTSFPSEGSGWQVGYFLQPVKISPDSAYVATYHSQGPYNAQELYFPASFSNYEAIDSRYSYFTDPVFPENTWNRTNYGIDPIIAVENSTAPGQTVVIYRDTCQFDFSKSPTQFVVMLPEQGGKFMLPDSVTVYRAMYGAAQPHERLKNDVSLIAFRTQVLSGDNRRRITIYTTGAALIEKVINGTWTPVDEVFSNGTWKKRQ